MDPRTCSKCQGAMRVLSFIEDQHVIKKIRKTLGLWEVKPRPPPRMAKTQPLHTEPHIDYSDTQVCPSDNGLYHLAFIQNSRYVFRVEERIALPSSLSGASFRLELVRLPSLHYAPGFHFDTASIASRGDLQNWGASP